MPGYRTGAFVGAFVLDARFGLNAGFDVYDDRYGARPSGGELSQVERPADVVLDAAVQWIADARTARTRGQPWFAWVHLYDPHDPYDPPEPFRTRFADEPYAGEIAFADARLGDALDELRARGLLANTLVVVTADHGESLGEHQERTHGLFAYDATLRVPLIVWAPSAIRPATLGGPAQLVDVMPTVLDLVGVPARGAERPQPPGRSRRPASRSPTPASTSRRSTPASRGTGRRSPAWSRAASSSSTCRSRSSTISGADPGEQTNLYRRTQGHRGAAAPGTCPAMRGRRPCRRARRGRSRHRAAAAIARLRVARRLGARRGPPPRPTIPKTLIGLHTMLDDALAALRDGRTADAERLLKAIVARRADFTVAYDRLAQLYRDTGRLPRAIATLEAASRAGVADAASLAALGGYLQEAGNLARSAEVLEAARAMNPSEMEVYEKLGITYTRMGRFDDAHRMFAHMLSVAPNSATTYNNLGSLYLTERRWPEAVDALSRALSIDPSMANAHNGLGVAFAQQGELDKAIAEWRRALELRPDLSDARDNIQRAEKMKGRSDWGPPFY